ncbi:MULTISPECIES: LysR substrate-binding domain-containing protein [Paraburkholderia]|uniref:LysR substrate-binding domain-containing protein n=1 Tax=Paraburkholderia TaxID=1822464 RepID=UPI002256877D|nr:MULTISPECIES: LysR substrate-binding domain-containing protein [Paraburkholderia]MCX4161856.1 LysR substrate-binding domain-containing protein [Paraburkholderia megapolitana]MDN7157353.1 LysR substrate-binding domain-containing protein [Paraburkholderia sp. CHISQ3]MDQ6494398.1 LysR substrate-binding domain-containing protein [Paraburkholderia megapolitana]
MRLPSLRNLQVFEAAARYQSFREAAQSLFLTHGAVTRQVKALEEEMGIKLFARVGRRVVLTQHGQRLQLAMSGALQLISDAVNELRQETRPSPGRLRVTVVPSFANRWLMARIADFHAHHPSITVELVVTIAALDLSEKQIPLGIRTGNGKWDGLAAEKLATETLFPVISSAGVEGYDDLPSCPNDMLRYPLLNPYDEWERWFKRAGVNPASALHGTTYEDSSLLLRAVEERKGIALGRNWLVSDAIRDGVLRRLPGPAIQARLDYYVVYPTSYPLSDIARAFITWLHAQTANEPAHDPN